MAKLKLNDGGTLDVSIKTINPRVAKAMLKTGTFGRRRLQKARTKRYAHAMKMLEWVVGQPILLDPNGELIDGQHRLQAVILFGGPVEFLVIRGFDHAEIYGKVDDVGVRRLKDWFHEKGENNPEILSVVVNMAAMDEAGRVPTGSQVGRHFTPIEGCEFLNRHPKIRDSIGAPGTTAGPVARGMATFAHYKFAQKDRALADSFFVDLIIGDKEGERDPIYLLREKLKSDHQAKTHMTRTECLALVYKTWNSLRTGARPRTLRWRSTGPSAEKFPEVV